MQIKIGGLVCGLYEHMLRFGRVVSARINDDGWTHFKVKWLADAAYEQSERWRSSLSKIPARLDREYRADELTVIDPGRLHQVLGEFCRAEEEEKR